MSGRYLEDTRAGHDATAAAHADRCQGLLDREPLELATPQTFCGLAGSGGHVVDEAFGRRVAKPRWCANPQRPDMSMTEATRWVWGCTDGAHTPYRRNYVEGGSTLSTVPTVSLNDGASIPQLGFGVYQVKPDETANAVKTALDIGYRHIDTAEMYQNERGVGEGIRNAGVDRAEVFVTSKLNNGFHRPDDARRAFDKTLSELGFDYVDLFLIHWPLPTRYDGDFVSTWQTLEEFKRDGRARSIGVSNFQVGHLERLARETETVPAVNQIEVHPYFVNDSVRAYGKEHGIATEAWSPIAQGQVLDDPTVTRIAEATGKSPAQVVLRWHIQRGDIIFPKSVTPQRVKENFDLFDFELSGADVDALSDLDKGEHGRIGPNPDTFDYIPD
jgi:2,5-diketo-D-gluconate reductase A